MPLGPAGEAEPTAEQPKAAQPPGVLRKAWDAYKVYVLFVAVPVAPALIVFAIWKCTSMVSPALTAALLRHLFPHRRF